MKHLLLLGGGHSHIEVLRRFASDGRAGADVTLIDTARDAVYSGMLPGAVAGLYSAADCRIDLAALTGKSGARFICASALAIDPQRRVVLLVDGGTVEYNILSIDVGSALAAGTIAGVAAFALPVKPADTFLAACDALAARARTGAIRRVAVVGGGAAGIEIAFALGHRLRNACAQSIAVTLISDQPHLLAGHQPRAQHMVERIVSKRGIAIHLGCRVLRVEAGAAVTATERIEADAIIWATGPAAPAWPAGSGLALDAEGFISVEASLQSVSHADVFAAGDCASVRGQPHPKSGVYAVRQGPLLAENLRRRLAGRPLIAFKPQPRALALLSSADGRAIGLYGPLAFEGAWVWRWKDRIDRGFVARYRL